MNLPLWFGQQRGAGQFAPDFGLDEDHDGTQKGPADDVPAALLGLLVAILGGAASLVAASLPLAVVVPLSVAGTALAGFACAAVFLVGTSDDAPGWALVITAGLAAVGDVIKWAFIIGTVVIAIALLISFVAALAAGTDRR